MQYFWLFLFFFRFCLPTHPILSTLVIRLSYATDKNARIKNILRIKLAF